ncbi:MAG TPA: hypothetical protein PLH11_02950 [Gemmobacter sp.]|nr:hypothetical protein [Gemmobacter sp.]
MKALALSLALAVIAMPVLAAGPLVSVEDPVPVVVPEAAPGSSGGVVVVPLLTLLILAAAVAK